MAIFSTSSVVGAISGNLGGACFVNGRGSPVIRKAKRIVESRSDEISTNRGVFVNSQRRWRTLSVSQREAWRTYANNIPETNRLGKTSHLSGFQMYIKTQVNLFSVFGFFSDDPPVTADQPILEPLTVSSTLTFGLRLFIPAFTEIVPLNINIKGILLWTDSLPKFAKGHRQIALISFNAGPTSTIVNFTSEFDEVFQLPILNQIVAISTSYAADDHTEWGLYSEIVKTTA